MSDSADDAEAVLQHACIDVMIHDLGGVAGALFLRADVLSMNGRESDARTIRSIGTEVRELGHHLRSVLPWTGQRATPDADGALDKWWPVIERFGRHQLPTGVRLVGHMNGCSIRAASTGPLARITLALLRDITTRSRPEPDLVTIRADTSLTSGNVVLLLLPTGENGRRGHLSTNDTPWLTYARSVGASNGISVEFAEGEEGFVLSVAAADS